MRRSLVLLAAALCMGSAIAATQMGAKPELGAWGVDLTAMDPTVKPGDDFFLFVNGTWMKKTEIPAERSSIGAFQLLRILSETRMKDMIAALQAKPYASLSVEEKKLRDLYEAFVDTKTIEANGLAPAKADLATIANARTLEDVARDMASQKLQTASVFNLGIGVDEKDPNAYSVVLAQGGLGMPDRDYYLKDDPHWRRRATHIRSTCRRCWRWPDSPMRTNAPRRSSTSRPRSRRSIGRGRRTATWTRPTIR